MKKEPIMSAMMMTAGSPLRSMSMMEILSDTTMGEMEVKKKNMTVGFTSLKDGAQQLNSTEIAICSTTVTMMTN